MSPPDELRAGTDEVAALREDYARLRKAFAEALAEERRLQAGLAAALAGERRLQAGMDAAELALGPSTTKEQLLTAELVQVRTVLDRVLHSPSWKLGSAMTALPRSLRDRWNR